MKNNEEQFDECINSTLNNLQKVELILSREVLGSWDLVLAQYIEKLSNELLVEAIQLNEEGEGDTLKELLDEEKLQQHYGDLGPYGGTD